MGGERQISLLVVTKLKDGSALMTNIAILRLRGHCAAQSVLRSRDPGCHFTPSSPRLRLPLSVSQTRSQSRESPILQYYQRFLSDRVAEEGGNREKKPC